MRQVQVESSNGARQCKTKLSKKSVASVSYSNLSLTQNRFAWRAETCCNAAKEDREDHGVLVGSFPRHVYACVCMRVCARAQKTLHNSLDVNRGLAHARFNLLIYSAKTFLRAAKIRYSYSHVCLLYVRVLARTNRSRSRG